MAISLEIENVFEVKTRGQFFVAVRRLDPKANFYITDKSFLDDIELEKYLDVPRALDENGNQRQDLVFLQLKYPGDAVKLSPKQIVTIIPGNEIHFLEPWHKLQNDAEPFNSELKKEMAPNHLLYGKQFNAIAKRQDTDDVIFELPEGENKFAVVHLTKSQKAEEDSSYPKTKLYENWLDLYNNSIVKDHIDFNS